MKNKLTIEEALKHLPEHWPDTGLWERIENQLPSEAIPSSVVFSNDQLPERMPPGTVWNSIEHELDKRSNRKFLYIALLAAAALFAVYVGFDFLVPARKPFINIARNLGRTDDKTSTSKQLSSNSEKNPMIKSKKSTGRLVESPGLKTGKQLTSIASAPQKPRLIKKVPIQAISTLPITSDTGISNGRVLISYNNGKIISEETIMPLSEPLMRALNIASVAGKAPDLKPLAKMDVLTGKVKEVSVPSFKEEENKNIRNSALIKARFALGLNYQSEPYDNGINRTTLRNLAVNVTAKTPRWQFYSGLGYAYAFENSPGDRQGKMAYSGSAYGTSVFLVNASYVSTNNMDALSAATQSLPDAASRQLLSSLVSSPVQVHHPYLTYDFGTSLKLFGNKLLSGWVTGGTGFSLKLDRQTSREKEIVSINYQLVEQHSQYTLPYNSYRVFNMDVNAGFQVGYQFTKRMTLLVEPSVNFLIVPVFNGYLNHSDLFSLGLKTGLRMNLHK